MMHLRINQNHAHVSWYGMMIVPLFTIAKAPFHVMVSTSVIKNRCNT